MPKKLKKKTIDEDEIVDDEKEIDGVEDDDEDEDDELAAAGMHVEDEDEEEAE